MNSIIRQQQILAGIKPTLLEYNGTGCNIHYSLPIDLARRLALDIPGAEPAEDLHITLCYLGKQEDLGPERISAAISVVENFTKDLESLGGKIGGIGRFSGSPSSDGKDVFYLSVNVPYLESLYIELVKALDEAGVGYQPTHGFTPHITLAYIDRDGSLPLQRIEQEALTIDSLTVTIGTGNMNRKDFAFGG